MLEFGADPTLVLSGNITILFNINLGVCLSESDKLVLGMMPKDHLSQIINSDNYMNMVEKVKQDILDVIGTNCEK